MPPYFMIIWYDYSSKRKLTVNTYLQVEDGLMDGEVLFHELVEKTEEEKALIKKKREEKRYGA